MARFLCTVWPFPGHLYPTLAVAQALRTRGHEVGFYSGRAARDVIEGEGFTFFPFDRLAARLQEIVDGVAAGEPGNDDDALYERLTARYAPSPGCRGMTRLRLVRATYNEWIIGTIPQQVTDLEVILDRWRPDVLLCEPVLWGPFLVLRERRDLPVAIFSFLAGCLVPGPDAPLFGSRLARPHTWYGRVQARLVATALAALTADVRHAPDSMRRRYGLSPLGEPVTALMGRMPLHLVATTPEYDFERRDLPPSVHYVGACLWDKPRQEAPPPWLQEMPDGQPIVYVTEGTSHVQDAVLLQAAARGLADLSVRAILTTGRRRAPESLGLTGLAPNVRVERFVPHSDLFPRLSAVVTNGGSSTVRAALAAGLPLVIVPMEWDQFDNAQRVVEAGAGIRLDANRCTPARVRAAVRRVLAEPSFRANARRLGAASARYGGPALAATLLESLALSPAARRRATEPAADSLSGVAALVGVHMEGERTS